MNTSEKNHMTMFRASDGVLGVHQETVDSIPPLSMKVREFRSAMDEILQRDNEYLGCTEGATAAKNSALEELVGRVFRIVNGLYVLGRMNGNEQLKAAGDISMSSLTNMRESDLEQYCSRIVDLVPAYTADLAQFGIPKKEIDALGKALATYRERVEEKQVKAAGSKAARKALYEAFERTNELLCEDIDTMIELVKTSNSELYEQYKAARNIHDIGGGRSSGSSQPEDSDATPEPEEVTTPAAEG